MSKFDITFKKYLILGVCLKLSRCILVNPPPQPKDDAIYEQPLTKTRYHSFLFLSSCVENNWSPFLLQAQLIVRTRTLKCWLRLFHDFASKTTVFQDLNLPRSLVHPQVDSHPQAKDVESPMVSRLQHLCGSFSCIGGKTMRPTLCFCLVCFISLFLLILQLHPMFWSFWVQFEMHKVGTNKLVKLEYFQDQREAPEKAAAQRWIHKTHK